MARPRTPTVLAEAAGAFAKHPARRRRGEPDTGRGIGPAPDHLPDEQRVIWDEIVGQLAPRLLQSSDRLLLERLVVLAAESRESGYDFSTRKQALLIAISAKFGMSPSDRARLSVPPSEEEERPKSGLASFLK